MKVGSFVKEEEPNLKCFTGRTNFETLAGADGDERDGSALLWRVHALAEAGTRNLLRSLIRSNMDGL